MIDHTNSRIDEHEKELRRENRRRYAFQRMLEATDRLLWRLEDLNRDGVKAVPRAVLARLRKVVGAMPDHVSESLRDTGEVQDTLDSLFEVQEKLFRWRFPGWHDFDPEGDKDDAVAS